MVAVELETFYRGLDFAHVLFMLHAPGAGLFAPVSVAATVSKTSRPA
jgi:hypothetical protein